MIKKELTIMDLIEVLKKSWIFMVVAAIAFGAVAKVYTSRNFQQLYTTTYVISIDPYSNNMDSDTDQSTVVTLKNSDSITYATRWMTTYITYLTLEGQKNKFGNSVSESLKNEENIEISPSTIKNSIWAISPREDTYMFDVTIVTADPDDSYVISCYLADCMVNALQEGFGNKNVKIADPPNGPYAFNSDNSSKKMIIAGALAAVGVYAIFFLINLFDVRIKTKDEIVKTYDLPLLGTIPDFESTNSKHYGGGYGYGNRKN